MILLLFFLSIGQSYAQIDKKLLIQKWSVSFEQTMEKNLPPGFAQILENMTEEEKSAFEQQKKEQKALLEKNYFLFKDGGIVEVYSSDKDEVEKGTWKLEENTIKMIRDKDGEALDLVIEELNNSLLSLKIAVPNGQAQYLVFTPWNK